MRAKLVQIGNSRGIRLPRSVIEEAGLSDDLELRVRKGEVVISSAKRVREGWAASAEEMAKRESGPVMAYHPTRFDEEEWKW